LVPVAIGKASDDFIRRVAGLLSRNTQTFDPWLLRAAMASVVLRCSHVRKLVGHALVW